ncbi:hypothetical protein [Actinacidiphila oryziradicis]|uniref:hypothetical protein n=1 Tax=Actinacidiphila oryziradicis TaxID=2571141 RepID=UPI00145D5EA6|nr:hypothetical protein [Actinacidiphila oryziradicis]
MPEGSPCAKSADPKSLDCERRTAGRQEVGPRIGVTVHIHQRLDAAGRVALAVGAAQPDVERLPYSAEGVLEDHTVLVVVSVAAVLAGYGR